MELNPFAYEFHEDPYPIYRWLRAHAPLYRNERMGFWALSRYEDVLAALLGVPAADRMELREWMDQALDRDPDTPELPPRAIEAMMKHMQYWYGLLQEVRRRPNQGLLSALLDAEIESDGGRTTKLEDGEIVGLCSLLGAAGNETTTKLLANAAVLFARHRDEYTKILVEPTRIPGA